MVRLQSLFQNFNAKVNENHQTDSWIYRQTRFFHKPELLCNLAKNVEDNKHTKNLYKVMNYVTEAVSNK